MLLGGAAARLKPGQEPAGWLQEGCEFLAIIFSRNEGKRVLHTPESQSSFQIKLSWGPPVDAKNHVPTSAPALRGL